MQFIILLALCGCRLILRHITAPAWGKDWLVFMLVRKEQKQLIARRLSKRCFHPNEAILMLKMFYSEIYEDCNCYNDVFALN